MSGFVVMANGANVVILNGGQHRRCSSGRCE